MIERHVTSLELSKKLDALQLKKQTLFVWEWINDQSYGIRFIPHAVIPTEMNGYKWFNAYTSSELLEIIPTFIDTKKDEPFNNFRIRIEKFIVYEEGYFQAFSIKYICDTYDAMTPIERILCSKWDISLSNALAKMILFLDENNLFTGSPK